MATSSSKINKLFSEIDVNYKKNFDSKSFSICIY